MCDCLNKRFVFLICYRFVWGFALFFLFSPFSFVLLFIARLAVWQRCNLLVLPFWDIKSTDRVLVLWVLRAHICFIVMMNRSKRKKNTRNLLSNAFSVVRLSFAVSPRILIYTSDNKIKEMNSDIRWKIEIPHKCDETQRRWAMNVKSKCAHQINAAWMCCASVKMGTFSVCLCAGDVITTIIIIIMAICKTCTMIIENICAHKAFANRMRWKCVQMAKMKENYCPDRVLKLSARH